MAPESHFHELGLNIIGIGTHYPPHSLKPDSLNVLSRRFYPETPSMKKVLWINQLTGIDTRSSVGTPDHPLVNQEHPAPINELHGLFMTDGVPLAIRAAQKAIAEAGIQLTEITHIVSTTCTDSANPGFDYFVAKGLGITHPVEKVLLHGVACSGGLAALRTAANLALGHAMRRKPARILCITLEMCTMMARSELQSIHDLQETRIGATLFSDCASAVILSNGLGEQKESIYELLGWEHRVIPDTERELSFDINPVGWKVGLTPKVPKLAQESMRPIFDALINSLPPLPPAYRDAANFDWALHPGGVTILSGAIREMKITIEHLRASYDVYMKHGNSSSATIFSVLNRLRNPQLDEYAVDQKPRELVVSCAFGPGMNVEMCMLKRNLHHCMVDIDVSDEIPPEALGQGARDEGRKDSNGATAAAWTAPRNSTAVDKMPLPWAPRQQQQTPITTVPSSTSIPTVPTSAGPASGTISPTTQVETNGHAKDADFIQQAVDAVQLD